MPGPGTREKLEGKRFGRWLVVEYVGRGTGGSHYRCVCDCGTERIVFRGNLLRGKTVSCGCAKAKNISKARTVHGHARKGDKASPTYSSWSSMLTRCTNPNCKAYPNYGGRGIQVCDRWKNSFENFLADMGEKPNKGMSIERLDPDGHYEPGNCVWANARTQGRNRRNTKLTPEIVKALRAGELSVLDAEKTLGINRNTLYAAKVGRNWSDSDGEAA